MDPKSDYPEFATGAPVDAPDLRCRLGLYDPGLTSPERRRRTTVARQHLVDDTLELLRGSTARRSRHHLLFLGPSGIGKTHLLHRIADDVADDTDLASRCVVARLPEPSHRILSFADFLLRLCEALRAELPDEPLWEELHDRLQTASDEDIVDQLVPQIRRTNREHERTILVLLENLDELLTRQIKDRQDTAALRKFFMNDNGCLLLATATAHFEGITSAEQPFYDFFDVQMLDPLDDHDTIELIRRNLELDERHGLLAAFDAMRPQLLAHCHMIGGNPRLAILLYDLIAGGITDVRAQFESLVDRISPLYRGRIEGLPPQERALLETMAVTRDQERAPSAITARIRLSQPQTSTLLKRLADARHLRSSQHATDKRRRIYTIRDGFFDVWLAMHASRTARERLPCLVEFFALYHEASEGNEDPDSRPGYLDEISAMIDRWQRHRAGDLEQFAWRLVSLGKGLSAETFAQVKAAMRVESNQTP